MIPPETENGHGISLPAADRRYASKKKPASVHRKTALHALAATGAAGGYVVVRRRGPSGGKRVALVQRAWNVMVSEAEARHISYWVARDGGTK